MYTVRMASVLPRRTRSDSSLRGVLISMMALIMGADQPLEPPNNQANVESREEYIRQLRRLTVEGLTPSQKMMLEAEDMKDVLGGARSLKRSGKYEEAIIKFENTVRSFPHSLSSLLMYHWLGDSYEALGELAQADAARHRGLDATKSMSARWRRAKWAPMISYLAVILYADLDTPSEDEIVGMIAAANLCGTNPEKETYVVEVHLICARKLRELGRLSETEAQYRKSLEAAPGRTGPARKVVITALGELVGLLRDQDRLQEAEALCKDLEQKHPGNRLASEARKLLDGVEAPAQSDAQGDDSEKPGTPVPTARRSCCDGRKTESETEVSAEDPYNPRLVSVAGAKSVLPQLEMEGPGEKATGACCQKSGTPNTQLLSIDGKAHTEKSLSAPKCTCPAPNGNGEENPSGNDPCCSSGGKPPGNQEPTDAAQASAAEKQQ